MKRYTWITTLVLFVLLPSLIAPAAAQQEPVRIIFMHHSTGEGLIWQGGVREAFAALGYEFWDHGYNEEGLVDPEGNYLGINWDVPGDNTDPDGWYAIFDQPVTEPPTNTFSHMLEYDVIIFKSCFPSSDIYDDDMFQAYQRYFARIRDVIDQHPDKLFIPFTTPPLVPNETTLENAGRARRWAEYLTSPEYLDGHPNIAVFDFFNTLADDQGFLRSEYRSDEWDSHPNERANQIVGPIFVEFVDQAIRDFVPGEPPEVVEPTENVEPPDEVDDELSAEPLPGGMIADFEDSTVIDNWWTYINDGMNDFVCDLDSLPEGGQALRLTYDAGPGGNAGCGADQGGGPEWVDAQGIQFKWRADMPGLVMRVGLGVQRPADEEATPFEIEFYSEDDAWHPVTITWDQLVKAEWYGDAGVDEFDPALVAWLVFDVGHWEQAQAGSIWIDDIQLALPE
jgi:hypothetical protein